MTRLRYLLVILMMVMASACSDTRQGQTSKSLPDSQENRTAAAKRYLEIMPPKEMLQGLANRIGPNLAEKDRKVFMDVMNSPEVEKAAYRITLDGLVKHFTVSELNAMVAFYGSPDGKSAYKKSGAYMGEIMPQIQQEVRNGLQQAQKQAAPQVPAVPQPQTGPPPQMAPKAPPGTK